MKVSLLRFAVAVIMAFSAEAGFAQGQFQNLDFESAIQPLVPDAFGMVPATNAIPGWIAYLGGQPVTTIAYESTALDAANLSLEDFASGLSIQGSYFVYLQSATVIVPAGDPLSAAIGQVGTIPSDAQALLFAASFGVPQVTFAGQALPVTPLGPYSSSTLYGANIAGYAGMEGELLFSVTRQGTSRQQVLLDAISFSTTPIPEPSALALLGLGLLGLGWHRWRNFHR